MRHLEFSRFNWACVLGFLSIFCAVLESHAANGEKNVICNTDNCKEIGTEIITLRDASVGACDNFFEHACGNWTDEFNVNSLLMAKLQEQMLNLTEKLASHSEFPADSAMRKVVDYYRSCNDYAVVNKEGLKQLASMVKVAGGWPLSIPPGKSQSSSSELQTIHEIYAKVSERPALFDITVDVVDEVDPSNNEDKRSYMIHLKVPADKREFLADLPLQDQGEYVVAVAKEFAALENSDELASNVADQVQKMLAFEESLKALNSSGDGEIVTIEKLQEKWNKSVPEIFSINWLENIRCAFTGTNVEIDSSEKIRLVPGNIVEQYGVLLKGQDKETVVNYIHWDAISTLAPHTSENMFKLLMSSSIIPFEEQDVADLRSLLCYYYTKMGDAISYAYIEEYKMKATRTAVIDMAKDIQQALLQEVGEWKWMDDISKDSSRRIINDITKQIGYPEWYYEPGIDQHYSDLVIDDTKYVQNVMNAYEFERRNVLKKLRQPFALKTVQWPILPLSVEQPTKRVKHNTIFIPAVWFQRPYYDAEIQEALNFGGLGSLIAREMSRAFDTQGLNLDAHGFKKQTWTNESVASYSKKLECLIDTYNAVSTTDEEGQTIAIDGKKTLDENIADYLGVKMALKAYRSRKDKKENKNIRIKSLNDISDDQLFFYSFGQSLCSRGDTYDATESTRPPPSVRANTVVSNIPEFASAFNCPIGSPMNPEKKWNFYE